jgi:hypothetical protein
MPPLLTDCMPDQEEGLQTMCSPRITGAILGLGVMKWGLEDRTWITVRELRQRS